MPEQNGSELASIDTYLVQRMDFKLPARPQKKPTWKSDPLTMSFTAKLSNAKPGVKFRKYPDWLARFMKSSGLYGDSACIRLANEESKLDFATEFAAAIEVLEEAAGRRNERPSDPANESTNGQAGSARTSEQVVDIDAEGEHILLDEEEPAFTLEATGDHSELDISNLDAWLFYDASLRQWQIVYKFTITTTAAHLNDLVVASPGLRRKRSDLYNIIRDLFTVSDGTDKVIPSVKKIQAAARARAVDLCRTIYGLKKSVRATDILSLPDDATNVSFFISTRAAKQVKNNLVRETDRAERRRGQVLDFFGKKRSERGIYRNVELFQSGGRFNTVLIDCDAIGALGGPNEVAQSYQMQFMPTLFQSALMQGYLERMSDTLQLIERQMLTNTGAKEEVRERYYTAVANSIEFARFENETFKGAIEQDHALFYAKIEEKRGIERSLAQMSALASHVTKSLEHKRQTCALTLGRRRNVALFLIVLLGVFGLVGVWSGYLDLMANQQLHLAMESPLVSGLFPNVETLVSFSAWLPAIALAICAMAVICLIFKRPR